MLDYQIIGKFVRKNAKVWFHKRDFILKLYNKTILIIEELIEIKNPSKLQQCRYIVLKGPNLVETDAINDIIHTDYNGNRVFVKNIEILSWF